MFRDTKVVKHCGNCKESFFIEVNDADLVAWQGGAFAQKVFSYLSAAERELLISGICGSCFDRMFPEED